jgi:hypothetical protein
MDINPNCVPSVENKTAAQEKFNINEVPIVVTLHGKKDKSKALQEGKQF